MQRQPLKRLLSLGRRKVRQWAFERERPPRPSVTLQRKRIYIVPTRAGAGFGLVCFLLLLGAMNYSNSLAFALCFLMASLGLIAMQQTHRNLLGLQISCSGGKAVFAGQDAHFQLQLHNPTRLARHAIGLRFLDSTPVQWCDLPAATTQATTLPCATRQRGWQAPPRILISTRFPFGLFVAWSYARLDARAMVYPAPLPHSRPPPPSRGRQQRGHMASSGQEDYAGLRDYQAGDSPRHIHWRAYPHHDALLVKQFADPVDAELWLDWEQLAQLPAEQRLRQLCSWVLQAQRAGHSYGLRLPTLTHPPACSPAHQHRCLAALALFPT